LGSKTTQFWASKRRSFGHFTIFFKRKNIKKIKNFIYFFRIFLEKKGGGGRKSGVAWQGGWLRPVMTHRRPTLRHAHPHTVVPSSPNLALNPIEPADPAKPLEGRGPVVASSENSANPFDFSVNLSNPSGPSSISLYDEKWDKSLSGNMSCGTSQA
jgi:hypothetical protein